MNYVFLILHYINADVTIKCINSIQEVMPNEQYSIVVVDNASRNGSYEELQKKYEDDSRIHLISNEENLGYARGNNVGFVYAKNVLKAEWICLANNDLIFFDSGWIDKTIEFYNKTHFYVLGPDIVTPEGEHQNPFKTTISNKKLVLKKIFHDRVVYFLLKIGIQRKLRKRMNIKDAWQDIDYKTTYDDFQGTLHGSCLIFSPDFINKYDGLYGGTFLYAEEEILCYILRKLGHTYSYNSQMQVIHCHATSFKRSVQNEDKRKRVIVKHRIYSYKRFLKILRCKDRVEQFLKEEKDE